MSEGSRPSPALNTWEARLRVARIVNVAFLASVLTFGVVGELLGPAQPRDFATIRLVFFAACASVAVVGFQFRRKMIPAAEDSLRRDPDDSGAAQRWLAGHTISYALAETIAACGFALRFLGGSLFESLPFYIIATGLLLAWLPTHPD